MTLPPMSLSPHYSSSLPSSYDGSALHSFPVFSVFVFEGREERLVESGRKALKRSSPGTWMSSGESGGGGLDRVKRVDWRERGQASKGGEGSSFLSKVGSYGQANGPESG